MKAALSLLLLGYLVCAMAQQAIPSSQPLLLESNLLTVQGYGSYLVSTNTTTLVVTLYGYGPNASFAQQALLTQVQYIQKALSNLTLLNFQIGGIMYYPYYGAPLGAATGQSTTATGTMAGQNVTGFITTTSLSFSLNALEAATALDALMANGTAFISISSRPDAQEIEQAQIQAVSLAVNDALFKAQAALSRLGICALNFTLINIESPMDMFPAVNILSDNFGLALAAGLNLPNANAAGSVGVNGNTNNLNNLNNNNAGAGRMQVTADVLLSLFHTSCSSSGAIQDLTANLTLPSSPILGSSALSGLFSPSASPVSSPSASPISGSPSGSFSGSSFITSRRRSFW